MCDYYLAFLCILGTLGLGLKAWQLLVEGKL
jgi:hypothetical protein